MDFAASNNSIVKNYYRTDESGKDFIDSDLDIWDGFWNTGEANSHNQTFNLTYQLPFKFIPFLDFITSSYNYLGNFNWEKGSTAMALVEDDNGNLLGEVNTIQNSNIQNINMSFNMPKFYRTLNIERNKKSKNKFKNSVKTFLTRFLD